MAREGRDDSILSLQLTVSLYIYANEISLAEFSTGKGIVNTEKFVLGAALKTFRTRVDGARLEEGRDGGVFRDPSYSKRGGIDLDVYLSAAERRISDEHKLHAPRERIN